MRETRRGIFRYSRFLELWKDCDEELRLQVNEVEKRLERLKEGAWKKQCVVEVPDREPRRLARRSS
jgi:hypothetical protein